MNKRMVQVLAAMILVLAGVSVGPAAEQANESLAAPRPRAALARAEDAPAHGRPFFMPPQERTRIRQLIATQEWAKADHTRSQEAARKGNGFLAAFLYALDGDPVYVPIAQKWLLGKFGTNAGLTKRARGALDNPEFFKAGVPSLNDVFYDTSQLLCS